jgi:glucan phosphoethanolaminetransferase (alkaline phosphatase superfamily)
MQRDRGLQFDNTPLVKGGQGRTAAEVQASSTTFTVCLALVGFIVGVVATSVAHHSVWFVVMLALVIAIAAGISYHIGANGVVSGRGAQR